MPTLSIELPRRQTQARFNLRRWAELLTDSMLAQFEGRIETDRHGQIIKSPPPSPSHGSYQFEIGHLLRTFMANGRVLTECPISTADGIKAADVAWASPQRLRELGNRACFLQAPEICVEVVSPGNTAAEMREKMALYFDAGAKEVWLCSHSGTIQFHLRAEPRPAKCSRLCPAFPKHVKLT